MRHVLWLALLTAAGATGALHARAQEPAAPAPAPATAEEALPMTDLEKLWWMAGTWEGDLFKARFQEHWMRPRGGVMLGAGRLIRDGKAVFTEFLRIQQHDDGVRYTVWPGERGPTTYTLTSLKYEPERKLGHAVFSNPEHQRQHTIEYLWNGDGLAGRIAGVRDGKEWEQRFTFDPSPDGRKAPAGGGK